MMNTLVLFPVERVVFIREHATGAFGTLIYYLAKVVAEIPFLVVFPFIFAPITYWMVTYWRTLLHDRAHFKPNINHK